MAATPTGRAATATKATAARTATTAVTAGTAPTATTAATGSPGSRAGTALAGTTTTPRSGRRSSSRRPSAAGSWAATGAPRRCRWCPSRSATAGSRWAARHHRHRVRVGRLHRQLVLRRLLPPRQRERDSQDGRGPVPADRHAADRVRDGVPAEPARVLLPDAHAPPGHPRQPGPVLRHQAPDADHDHPLLPGGRAGHHDHAADGRAPGVPRQVGRAADR